MTSQHTDQAPHQARRDLLTRIGMRDHQYTCKSPFSCCPLCLARRRLAATLLTNKTIHHMDQNTNRILDRPFAMAGGPYLNRWFCSRSNPFWSQSRGLLTCPPPYQSILVSNDLNQFRLSTTRTGQGETFWSAQ